MIRWLIGYLSTPSAYPGRPWAYAANQLGHLLIGLIAAYLTGGWIATVALYVVMIEAPQLVWWGGEWSDGIEDVAHVAAGALALVVGWQVLVLSGLIIAAGVAWRIEARRT